MVVFVISSHLVLFWILHTHLIGSGRTEIITNRSSRIKMLGKMVGGKRLCVTFWLFSCILGIASAAPSTSTMKNSRFSPAPIFNRHNRPTSNTSNPEVDLQGSAVTSSDDFKHINQSRHQNVGVTSNVENKKTASVIQSNRTSSFQTGPSSASNFETTTRIIPMMKSNSSLLLQSLNSSIIRIRRNGAYQQDDQSTHMKAKTPSESPYQSKPYGASPYQTKPSGTSPYQSTPPAGRDNGMHLVVGQDGVKMYMNCICEIQSEKETRIPSNYNNQRPPSYSPTPYSLSVPTSYTQTTPVPYAPAMQAPYAPAMQARPYSLAPATQAPFAPLMQASYYTPATQAPYAPATSTAYPSPYGSVPSAQSKIGSNISGDDGETRSFDCICGSKQSAELNVLGLPGLH